MRKGGVIREARSVESLAQSARRADTPRARQKKVGNKRERVANRGVIPRRAFLRETLPGTFFLTNN